MLRLPRRTNSLILGAGFIGDGGGDAEDQIGVPGGGEADGFRENGGAAGARHAVEALVPPIVGRDAEPLDGGRIVHELGDFLLQGHAGEQVVDAFFKRRGRIFVEGGGCAAERYNPEEASSSAAAARLLR